MDKKEIEFFTFLLNSLRHAQDANTQALGKNTIAVEASTDGLGTWEAKDEAYHKEHHEILLQLSKTQQEILELLKKK